MNNPISPSQIATMPSKVFVKFEVNDAGISTLYSTDKNNWKQSQFSRFVEYERDSFGKRNDPVFPHYKSQNQFTFIDAARQIADMKAKMIKKNPPFEIEFCN